MREFSRLQRKSTLLSQGSFSRTVAVVQPASSSIQRPKAPPPGFAKLHVDAAVKADTGGLAAVVCRDSTGNFLGSSSLCVVGVQHPATLEAMACREALSLAADLHLHTVIISSDSKQVVEDIKSGQHGSYNAIIKEIRARAVNFNCNFIFEGRVINVDAHKLARFSLSLSLGRHVWFGQPHDLNCIPLCVVFDQ